MSGVAGEQERIEFIISQLRAICPDLPQQLPLKGHYMKDFKLESLELFELVARIEQHYGLDVPDVDVDYFLSIESTLDYLRKRIKA